MQINQNAMFADAALDTRISSAEDAAYEARKKHAVLLGERLAARLRAVFPNGGVLHLEQWSEAGAYGVSIVKITTDDGQPYLDPEFDDPDPTGVMGEDAYEAALNDVRELADSAGEAVGLYWKYGTATFTF